MTILTSRRSLILGAGASLLTAPAIVRASSLMPVKALPAELGGLSLWSELADMTRKVFVPRLFIQVYAANPISAALSGQSGPARQPRLSLFGSQLLSVPARDTLQAPLGSPRRLQAENEYNPPAYPRPIAVRSYDLYASS